MTQFDDSQSLKKIDLSDLKSGKIILQKGLDFIKTDDGLLCLRLEKIIDTFLIVQERYFLEHKNEREELLLLQHECWWVALPLIKEQKVIECFNKYLNIGWEISRKYDYYLGEEEESYRYEEHFLRGRLEDRLVSLRLLADRDKLKNKIVEALEGNEEIVTKNRLIIDNQSLKSTLANWFLIYHNALGTGVLNKLKQAQFYSENKNFQQLSAAEQIKLKIIFKVYEQSKLSSFTPEGNETDYSFEDEKGMGVIYRGEKQYYTKKEMDEIKELDEIVKKYRDQLIELGMIDENYFLKTDDELFEGIKLETTKTNNIKDMISDIPQYKPTTQPAGLKHDIYGSEDEQEIEKHKYSGLKKDRSLDINAILAELKEKLDLMFKAPEEEMQFNNLCTSYLKGIRDEMEFVGMLDYKTEMAEKIVGFLKKYRPAMPVKLPKQPLPPKLTPKMPTYQQAQNIMQKSVVAAKAQVPKIPAPMPARPMPQPPKPTYMPQVKRMESTKPVIQDIKVPAKDVRLIGPVEELGSFTLAKFRRLADTPVEAAEKIKEKVDLLEEQSIPAKAKGIVAFKNSPLNQIYLKIGNASIDQGRSVAEIISELSQQGQEYLTKEEFDCIADLNKKLRF